MIAKYKQSRKTVDTPFSKLGLDLLQSLEEAKKGQKTMTNINCKQTNLSCKQIQNILITVVGIIGRSVCVCLLVKRTDTQG